MDKDDLVEFLVLLDVTLLVVVCMELSVVVASILVK